MSAGPAARNLDHVRGRLSYRWLSQAAKILAIPNNRESLLRWLFDLLDKKRCFGSRLNAARAEESLEQLLKDLGGKTWLEKCPGCGGRLDFTGIDWQGPECTEVGEACSGCGRSFKTTFAAVEWKEVGR
jgi:hypothetical protein